MERERSEVLQGTLDLLILRTLLHGPQHGYGIVVHIQKVSSGVLRVEEGSLYPALHRIEQAGWINSEWGISDNNRRAKYYELTATGRKQLEAEKSQWKKLSAAVMVCVPAVFNVAVNTCVPESPGVKNQLLGKPACASLLENTTSPEYDV